MDEIIHTNSAATAPTTFTACFLKNQLTLWLRKAAHALSFGTLIPLTSEEELHLIIGKVQKFVSGDKMISEGRNHVSTATTNLLYFTL